ncbi:unnamed protein product [Meganyctiphanes norvegica]|uniref:Uncharacterized protein n=1 Tax=Meganyctiphanes norvegica TaxID=48144 RepID=A0AAV2Q7A6_MEGNR
MKAFWGIHMLGTIPFIIEFSGAFPYETRLSERLDQHRIGNENLLQMVEDNTYNDNIQTLENHKSPHTIQSALHSSEIVEDALKAQSEEFESEGYTQNDASHVESKYENEQNDKTTGHINLQSDNSEHSDQSQNARTGSGSHHRKPRSIPVEEMLLNMNQAAYGGAANYGGNKGGGYGGMQAGGGYGGGMMGGMMPMGGMMLPQFMPPAAYIPAPAGGIIPAIPPSTFIPPPPLPFPGAWGLAGFPGQAVGFGPLMG